MGKRGPAPRKGAPTSIRFEPALRQRLEASASESGRTFSEEVTARLELSFGAGDVEREFGNLTTYALCRLIAVAFKELERETGHPWFRHPWSFKHARDGVAELLSYFHPIGEPQVPDDAPLLTRLRAQGMPPEVVEKAKSQLGRNKLGVLWARMAVFSIESTLENDRGYLADELRGINAILKTHLSAAEMTGEAQADLIQSDGPEWTVKI